MEKIKKEIKKNISELKKGIKQMFKEFFSKKTNKQQRANMWTFSRLIIALIIPILTIISIITSSTSLLITTFLATDIGASTDYFDGKSARKHNSSSTFGKQLDAITDKLFAISLSLSLSLLNPIFLISLFGELAIAGTNLYYQANYPKLNITSSKIGKIKQWPLSIAFILGIISLLIKGLSPVTSLLVKGTFLLQLITLASYIKNNNELIKNINKEEIENELNNQPSKSQNKVNSLSLEQTNSPKQIKELKTAIQSNEILPKKYNIKIRILKKDYPHTYKIK